MTDHVEQIDAYLDGELSKTEAAAFRDWLLGSPRNGRIFAERAMLHHQIRDTLRRNRIESVQNPQHILKELLQMENSAEAELQQIPFESGINSRMKVLAAWGSIAAVILIAITLTLIFSGGGGTTSDPEIAQRSDPPKEQQAQAKVLGTFLAQWDTASPDPGEAIANGPVELTSGFVDFELAGGARVFVQAPARFEVIDSNRMALYDGSLVASVPPRAHGFTVHTNTISVVDLGTEFGVEVADDGSVTTAVFTGEVVLRSLDRSAPTVPLRSGQVAVADHTGRIAASRPLEDVVDDVLFVRSMDDARILAANQAAEAIIKMKPVAYWRFESIENGIVLDEMGNHAGRLVGQASLIDSVSGKGIDLNGTDAHVVVPAHPALDSLNKELTLCAWVKLANIEKQALIHNWDRPAGEEGAGYSLEIYNDVPGFVVTLEGAVGFEDHLFAESRMKIDEWVHLAAVYDGATKTIYINGVAITSTPTRRPDLDIQGGGKDLHIGRRQDGDWGHVNGVMDEVTVFDKALSADNVRQIHELQLNAFLPKQ